MSDPIPPVFEKIRDDLKDLLGVEKETVPEDNRIRVLVDMDHVSTFGHQDTLRELTYGCDFKVKIGDAVMCPPTVYSLKWRVGMVVSLNAGEYKGPVKQVRPIEGEE